MKRGRLYTPTEFPAIDTPWQIPHMLSFSFRVRARINNMAVFSINAVYTYEPTDTAYGWLRCVGFTVCLIVLLLALAL